MVKIPNYVKSSLWSYDIDKIDLEEHKERIITNILNHGTDKAVDWLFNTYSEKEIKKVIKYPFYGEWDKKSLNFWALISKVTPNISKRSDYVL